MDWAVTDQVIAAYRSAKENDPPTQKAMERLWARLDIDPGGEGTPLGMAGTSPDKHMRRIERALAQLEDSPIGDDPDRPEPRITYEPVEGPTNPPPWLAFSVHVPNWVPKGRTEDHTLVVMGKVDRHGKARL